MSSSSSHRRLATQAWESLFRAQVTVMRQLGKEPSLKKLGAGEYDILYTLTQCKSGWLRLNEFNDKVLISQPSISRMVERMEKRGLIQRRTADDDRRGVLIGLTEAGAAAQKEVGREHVKHIAELLGAGLDEEEMRTLLALTTKLRTSVAEQASAR
ncbi:MarR family winged helix-turn-helix transcriptional regulator [Arthrobacter sp. 35W]|uniref:MarR family winged helix-turn-helix transcriptional regulator n=1 Tax=Arthrobacter sp. 35W TaxID=1132441 RepID=UPI000403F0E0|nr:MarR family transcriptional regulator [Arthrobacter sp. 35W]